MTVSINQPKEKKGQGMKICNGTNVTTPLGAGIVAGIDLPESHDLWRYIVTLEKNIFDREKNAYCFFPGEVSAINSQEPKA